MTLLSMLSVIIGLILAYIGVGLLVVLLYWKEYITTHEVSNVPSVLLIQIAYAFLCWPVVLITGDPYIDLDD